MTIGEKIFKLRAKAGISQEQLAEKLGVSRQAVSRWESGETTPDMANIIGLCNIFGVSADHLIRGGETAEAAPVSVQHQPALAVRDRYHIFRLISAGCFQVGVVASVIGICFRNNIWQSLLSGLFAGVCSGLASFQFVSFGKGLR